MMRFVAYAQFDGGFGIGFSVRFVAGYADMIANHFEGRLCPPQKPAQQEIEGSIGRLIFIATKFELFQLLQKSLHFR